MGIYITLLLGVIVSLFIYKYTNKKVFSIIPYLMMAVVAGFRYEVGVDYLSYKYQYYDVIAKTGWSINFEPGFQLLVKANNYLGFSYQMVFLVVSFATCILYYDFIYNNSTEFELSTIMFMCLGPYYFSSFNTIRESLAIALFLYAIKFYSCVSISQNGRNNKKNYYIMLLVSASFHISALLVIIVSILYSRTIPYLKKNIKSSFVFMIFGVLLLCGILNSSLMTILINTFFKVRIKLTNFDVKMDSSYLLYLFLCLVILILYRVKMIEIRRVYRYMIIFTCILISVAVMIPQYSMLLTRFVSWGTQALLIVLPTLKKLVKPQWVYGCILVLGCVLYYIMLVHSSAAHLLPYTFNFDLRR